MNQTTKKPTFKALAKLYKVHEKTVAKWNREGLDVYDAAAVADATGGGQKNSAPNNRDTKLRDLRAQKLQVEIDRIRFAHQKEQGLFIDAKEAHRGWISAMTQLRGEILGFLENTLPNMAGLSAVEMHGKGREWFNSLCEAMQKDPVTGEKEKIE